MTQEKDGGISKVKLAVGAASLFLFLIGLKRSFRKEDGTEILSDGETVIPAGSPAPDVGLDEKPLRQAS